MAKTHVNGGHIGKWRLPPLCHPQPPDTMENHNLHIHTITTTYHTISYHQNCHEITYAPLLLAYVKFGNMDDTYPFCSDFVFCDAV